MHVVIEIDGERHELWLLRVEDKVSVEVGGETYELSCEAAGRSVAVGLSGRRHHVELVAAEKALIDGRPVGYRVAFFSPRGAPGKHEVEETGKARIRPPMPGRIVAVRASEGEKVAKGDVLMILEAMKMQNEVTAPTGGVLKRLLVKAGDVVDSHTVLAEIEG
ncbi:MAG: biotin/lipoyl-binding protein [Euryarchaeota archaeon]|nr:biotin/lipoyl-binding protein [Euryarchaeota archaeon]